MNKTGCPVCCNRSVGVDNNLSTVAPHLILQWGDNNKVTPEQVLAFTSKIYWWKCNRGHVYQMPVRWRTVNGYGCALCSRGQQVSKYELRLFCELQHYFYDALWGERVTGIECDILLPSIKQAIQFDGSQWHKDITERDTIAVGKLKQAGIETTRIRQTPLAPISSLDIEVPKNLNPDEVCAIVMPILGFRFGLILDTPYTFKNDDLYHQLLPTLRVKNRGLSLAEYPKLVEEWSDKNYPYSPADFSHHSSHKAWWKCTCGHEWQTRISCRVKLSGKCPMCRHKQNNKLSVVYPKLAAFWDYSKNEFKPDEVSAKSNKKVWWCCSQGHQWQSKINNLARYGNTAKCRYCKP